MFLTLIKNKNTIICLQIFKKHAKLTYLFIWKTMLVSYSPLKMCVPGPNVGLCFGLWDPPTASLPIVFRHPRLPVGGKHGVFHFSHRHVHSFLLVSSIWQPVYASSLRRRDQYPLQYFEFGLSILHTAPLILANIGESPHPPPMCSIHLDDARAAILRQNAHHTPAYWWKGDRVMKPISVWGGLGGHDGQRPMGEFGQDAGVTPYSFSKDILGFLMTTEKVRTSV